MLKSDIFHHIFTFNIETTRKSGLKQDFAGISVSDHCKLFKPVEKKYYASCKKRINIICKPFCYNLTIFKHIFKHKGLSNIKMTMDIFTSLKKKVYFIKTLFSLTYYFKFPVFCLHQDGGGYLASCTTQPIWSTAWAKENSETQFTPTC